MRWPSSGEDSLIRKPETCIGCPLYAHSQEGFLRPSGDFRKGVLIVGEAAGEQEAAAGIAFVGKSGYYLWNALRRVGLERDDFRIANVLSCRPPNNKLVEPLMSPLVLVLAALFLTTLLRLLRKLELEITSVSLRLDELLSRECSECRRPFIQGSSSSTTSATPSGQSDIKHG